jgi:hypothetical protein
MPDTGLTALNQYTLTAGAEAFRLAITRLADRVQREGHPGLLTYRFFIDAEGATARAVVDYRDAEAWIGHHDLAMPWPEMAALHAVARLSQVTFLGAVSPEITAWIAGSSLRAQITQGYSFAAGFRRGVE